MRDEPIRQESYALVDRLAAAFMRSDIEGARDIADWFHRNAEARGWRKKEEDLEDASRSEMQFNRMANAWFETKDGLTCLRVVKNDVGVFPPIWKLPCYPDSTRDQFLDTPTYLGVEVRTYEFKRRHKDGRPIYVEI